MLVTEQVDAMRAMGTDPMPQTGHAARVGHDADAAAAYRDDRFRGLAGRMRGGGVLRCDWAPWSSGRARSMRWILRDLMQGMMKPAGFGFILATVGCCKGLTVRGGTQGVGRATTQAVVVASVLIIVADLFLTKLALVSCRDKIF